MRLKLRMKGSRYVPVVPPPPVPTLRRVTGTYGEAIPGVTNGIWGNNTRHQYAKVGAWNADGSILKLINQSGTPEPLYLDGVTYAPLNMADPIGGIADSRWHQTDPDLQICVTGTTLLQRNVQTDGRTTIKTFPSLASIMIGNYEGNLSDDGNWIVLTVPNTTTVFAYNMNTDTTLANISTGMVYVDYATISPSGTYILVNGAIDEGQYDRTNVFLRATGALHASWTSYGRPSHFDLTYDGNGDEVAVGVSKSAPDDGSIVKKRLSDGTVTRLTSFGYGWHTSARNYQSRGVVVSAFGPNLPEWGTHSDEAILVGLDALDDIQTVCLMNSITNDYWAEPQPTISPDGSKIVFAGKDGQGTYFCSTIATA